MHTYTVKGALRATASFVFPSMDVRTKLPSRRYCIESSYSEILKRHGKALNVTPVFDRQLKKDFLKDGNAPSYCLRLRFSATELIYEESNREPWVGVEFFPRVSRNVICENLSLADKNMLMRSWEGGQSFESFMELAGLRGDLIEKESLDVLALLDGATRLAYITGRSTQPDIVTFPKGPGAQPL